ncbi:hypothetical protein H6P81_016136 [Aristolochia fimbriata]|uniref:Uncharacterized protein n=1 Tax=Aristolochia fimbriata TaxID=158543 RepID=A0AAV7EAI6_ARIFI|nr:hypothetical protein H6P81_016136 [Aristolochia fimbriata]
MASTAASSTIVFLASVLSVAVLVSRPIVQAAEHHDSMLKYWMPARTNPVGECSGQDELIDLDSEINRRNVILDGKRGISYDALRNDSVRCSQRGASYYGCESGREANPYKRSCSIITKCDRRPRA